MGAILFQFFFILVSSPSSCCCCCWGCCCCGSGGCSSNRAPCCFWFVRAFLFEWISFLFVCLFVGSKMAVGEANGPVEDNSFDLEFANLFVSMNFRVRNSFFFLEGGGREREAEVKLRHWNLFIILILFFGNLRINQNEQEKKKCWTNSR